MTETPSAGRLVSLAGQRTILKEILDALRTMDCAGTIVDEPYRWRRDAYEPVAF